MISIPHSVIENTKPTAVGQFIPRIYIISTADRQSDAFVNCKLKFNFQRLFFSCYSRGESIVFNWRIMANSHHYPLVKECTSHSFVSIEDYFMNGVSN
jgi:hypothetical protein